MLGFLWPMDLGLKVFKVIVIRWLGLHSIIIIKVNAQGYKSVIWFSKFIGCKGYVIRVLDVKVSMAYGFRVKGVQGNCN
jgi:hypothetical protein